MKVIIDRFEEGFAVVEMDAGKFANLPRVLLPEDAREGDTVVITVDREETEARAEKIEGMMNRLFRD